MSRPNPFPFVLALCLALATAGCSRVELAYNTADFFIERYADEWLALDGAQMAQWRPALAEALARHREDELPHLAAFFDALHAGAASGFDAGRVECLLDAFEDIYRRHFRIAADLATPLLADLGPEQIRTLERKFMEDRKPEDNSPAAVSRRERKRAERYAESAEWWVGPLSPQQREIVREVTAAMPDTAAQWDAYRARKQDALIRMLRAGADQPAIRRYLTEWLVDYRDLPPALARAREGIRAQVVELIVRVDATFSPAQRRHFAGRLATVRDDLLSLQPRPQQADNRCRRSE